MEICLKNVTPHPQLPEILFAHRRKVSSVFRDIIGIHEINHIALTKVDKEQRLLILSSTPALEFNLFNSPLWRFDQSYCPDWFNLGTHAYWQALYATERYDELYYLKQIRLGYPIGMSLALRRGEEQYIFSFASHRSCQNTQELFSNKTDDLYKIGLYCTNQLRALFDHTSPETNTAIKGQPSHETSN